MSLTKEDQAILSFTSNAIGRTGAKSLEVGHLDEDPPRRWYATAAFQGAKIICDGQDDPVDAILGLYVILAAGALCVECERPVALDGGQEGLVDGGRMHEGEFQTHPVQRPREEYCVRWMDITGWTSCNG